MRIISACFFSLFLGQLLTAQNLQLKSADSLFSVQKYTEAYKKYEEVFDQNLASPAMLVKMAFIQEGLGNYADALYYLNLYYNKTSDKLAAAKMRELAEEHSLEGYEYSDLRYITGFFRKYNTEITACLLAFSLFLVAYSYRQFKIGYRPAISLGLQLVTLCLIAILTNGWFIKDKAIINQDNALLMTGPSAGAEPIDFAAKGNKVTLLSSDPLWSEIAWGEGRVYIRTKNLKVL